MDNTRPVTHKSLLKLKLKGFARFMGHQFLGPLTKKAYPLYVHEQPVVDTSPGVKKTIGDVHRYECAGCGLCAAVCKLNSVSMVKDDAGFVPVLDETSCVHCGLCYRSCPGTHRVSYEGDLGPIRAMYTGYAKDPQVRHGASSGGVTRSILKALLQQGLVDKVIITRAGEDPCTPETIITSDLADLEGDRINSVYSPVKPLEVLKQLDRNCRYAFVGLPCHIAGIHLNAAMKKMIPYTIGIFCSHTPGFPFVRQFVGDVSRENDVSGLRYRGDGWPGRSKIHYTDQTVASIPFVAMWHTYNYHKQYQQPRCSTCTWYSAEYADISVGDPWVLARKDHEGTSLVFVRTEAGEQAIQAAQSLIDIRAVEEHEKAAILKFHIDSAASKRAQAAKAGVREERE